MVKPTVSVISLGCPKNRVDSEVILGLLGKIGYPLTTFYNEADIVIINTCSFIELARDESYRVIKDVLSKKKAAQKLIVCGCLPQLIREKLFQEFPNIDAIIGSADFYKLPDIVSKLLNEVRPRGNNKIAEISEPIFIYDSSFPRLVSTPPSYAYLKISDGCSNRCSYCNIYRLRGEYRSREIRDIVDEAYKLANMGVKELILVGQDTTNFGMDKGGYLLPSLLQELESIDRIHWIRILYTHPAHFSEELIKVISNSKKVCRYIDIPLQHTHNEILTHMCRPYYEVSKSVIYELRKSIPDITLRTTFIVGFPGEKDDHFKKLIDDVQELEFDWLGAFTYSQEMGTKAFEFANQVPTNVKEERLARLMEVQRNITIRKNQQKVGKFFQVLVDSESEGHTEFQSPELDGKIIFSRKLTAGEIFSGRVKRIVNDYDLEVEFNLNNA
ncbi:MAG: 30S ribosomal protein S12 methylthiotransferase RimO [bacterium]|nr:30S ribosomal protein S12 methylthiotransferase RimO [bacterium]